MLLYIDSLLRAITRNDMISQDLFACDSTYYVRAFNLWVVTAQVSFRHH
jgi:hypothetical protein